MFKMFKVLLNSLALFLLLLESSHQTFSIHAWPLLTLYFSFLIWVRQNLTSTGQKWPLFLPTDDTDSSVLLIFLRYSIRGAQTLVVHVFPLSCCFLKKKIWRNTYLKLRIRALFIIVECSQDIQYVYTEVYSIYTTGGEGNCINLS